MPFLNVSRKINSRIRMFLINMGLRNNFCKNFCKISLSFFYTSVILKFTIFACIYDILIHISMYIFEYLILEYHLRNAAGGVLGT